jgi:hypothetical protein
VEESAGHEKTACLSCHAPASLVGGGEPRLRDWHREDGVDCQACHLDDDGQIVGPFDPERPGLLQAHPVKRDALYLRSNQLCGNCHIDTLEEITAFSRAPERTGMVPTCQQCHMQSVVRDLTQGGDVGTQLGAAANDARRQRRHDMTLSMEGSDQDEQIELELKLWREGDRLLSSARLDNGLPHALPTGNRFSRAEVQLTLVAMNASGETTERFEATFSAPGLAAGASHDLAAGELTPETKTVRLTATRTRPGHPDQVLATVEQAVPE